jgi:3-dehydroquinate synthase
MGVSRVRGRWKITAVQRIRYQVIRIWNLLALPLLTATDILGGKECAGAGRRRLVVWDRWVAENQGDRWRRYFADANIDATYVEIEAGEEAKTRETVDRIIDALTDFEPTPLEPVIAIGGGVVHDVVGEAMDEVYRGILAYVFVATTLVGLVDAGFGGKVGINSHGRKNYEGGFKPPLRVFLDPSLLATLEADQISDGMAELIKVGLMVDPGLIHLLNRYASALRASRFQPTPDVPLKVIWKIVKRGVKPMLVEQAINLWLNKTRRRWPEAGHGPCKQWEMMRVGVLHHGQCVALNLALDTMISWARGLLSDARRDHVLSVIRKAGLRIYDPVMEDETAMEAGLRGAAQVRAGGQAIPVPVDKMLSRYRRATRYRYLDDITVDEAMAAVAELRRLDPAA